MAATVGHTNAYAHSTEEEVMKLVKELRADIDRKKTDYMAESEILFAKLRTSYALGFDVARQIDSIERRHAIWAAEERKSGSRLDNLQLLLDELHLVESSPPSGPSCMPREPSWMRKGSEHCIKKVTKTAAAKLPSHALISKEIADRACRCLGIDPVKHRQ